MQNSKRLSNLTIADIDRFREDMAAPESAKYQSFLDETGTGFCFGTLGPAEQSTVRKAIDAPDAALAGPNILIWNNICRARGKLAKS